MANGYILMHSREYAGALPGCAGAAAAQHLRVRCRPWAPRRSRAPGPHPSTQEARAPPLLFRGNTKVDALQDRITQPVAKQLQQTPWRKARSTPAHPSDRGLSEPLRRLRR